MTGTNVGYLVGNGTSVVQQCTPISLGQWHMATLTYDNSVVKFYLNGEKQLESELTGPLNYADVGAPGGLTIGKMSSGADSPSSYFPFTGKIRDLRAYNTALGAEDILHLYQVSARISRQGVLTLFDIDERDIYL